MNEKTVPEGELFSRLYLERGAPTQDSAFFRNRLVAYLQENHYRNYAEISRYLQREAGLVVNASYSERAQSIFYDFPGFFTKTKIEYILSSITLIWRYLNIKFSSRNALATWPGSVAEAWHEFVSRALREENMAYTLDKNCGVHFFVDEEFERNRISILKCLEAPRYAGVRDAFENAHKHLDRQPADTKASVRSTFEAVEILARLIDPQSKNLNAWMVKNKLKPLALKNPADSVEADAVGKVFDGFAEWVDGIHPYRHGQGIEKAVAPSITLAVYIISTGAALVRWLAEIDSSQR